ncbi:MAG TPA: hypothetical protein VFJ51_06765, partial [Nitrososphaeraceae archaeon]|nr:hypothetical protein [Nitrososphaeraceae archaeon]
MIGHHFPLPLRITSITIPLLSTNSSVFHHFWFYYVDSSCQNGDGIGSGNGIVVAMDNQQQQMANGSSHT